MLHLARRAGIHADGKTHLRLQQEQLAVGVMGRAEAVQGAGQLGGKEDGGPVF